MKRYLLLIFVFIMASLFSGCKSKVTIPEILVVSQYSDEDLQEFVSTVDEKILIKAWGKPQAVDNRRFWPVPLSLPTSYLVAYTENGKITSLSKSSCLFVTVLTDSYCTYDWDTYYSFDGDIAYMPTQDVFGNAIEYVPGDMFVFSFDGIIEESNPAQFNAPFTATLMGHLSDYEFDTLIEHIELPNP